MVGSVRSDVLVLRIVEKTESTTSESSPGSKASMLALGGKGAMSELRIDGVLRGGKNKSKLKLYMCSKFKRFRNGKKPCERTICKNF